MTEPIKNLSEIINHMKTETALKSSELAAFSDLSTEDIIKVRMSWEFLSVEFKRSVAERLIELADNDATLSFDNLFRFMLADKDEQIKILAIQGLWENDQPSLLEPLIRLLEKDKSQAVRAEAAGALSKYALLAEMGELREALATRVAHVLFKIIENTTENIEVKARALEAIATLSQPKVAEVIRQAYASGTSRLKQASICAMGHSVNYTWIPILIAELNSEEPAERYEAVMAMGEFEDENTVAYLHACTKDDDLEVRLATVQTLKKIGGREAKSLLGEMSNDPSNNVAEAAMQAMAEMEDHNFMKSKDEENNSDEDEDESYSAS